ncbi:MAG: GNAT family N-acetyltransferase [Defluviitaleaceae bacterium]|nr:GNAT family N-acetyltransferase [Defluviitaleaceae bacterium]
MIKLAEKIGFEEIGRIKNIRRVHDERYDCLTFSIMKDEFFKRYNDVLQAELKP